jgi:hypothetical protein
MKSLLSHFAAALCAVALVMVVGAAAPEAPKDRIYLTSPDGKTKITIQARDDIAGLWLSSGKDDAFVSIFANEQGAAVGVYSKIAKGNRFSGVSAGPNGGDGRLQLSTDGEAELFDAGDLRTPPEAAKRPENDEPFIHAAD